MKSINHSFLTVLFSVFCVVVTAQVPQFVTTDKQNSAFVLTQQSVTVPILTDSREDAGVLRALENLRTDIKLVTGQQPDYKTDEIPAARKLLIIGTLGKNKFIDALIKERKIDATQLSGKHEKFLIQTISNPLPGVDEALIIVGSEKRGTIYGIYELSSQIGVSP